ncbi:MAG TPA: glycosyltransferase 61 family protein, partial [Acidisoma sp.]|nr:glycosyltransferase 61 family protein [Acidisoma sp.]
MGQQIFRLSLRGHASVLGDITAELSKWFGEPGSGYPVEGIAVTAAGERPDLRPPPLLEYQLTYTAELQTPWMPMPQFCGGRGLGLAPTGVRFRAAAPFADLFDCIYDVAFVGGGRLGEVVGPELASLANDAAIEAIALRLRSKQTASAGTARPPSDADDLPPPPGGESAYDDPTIRLRLLSPAFASAPPPVRNPGLIPEGPRHAMGMSWDRKGFKERPISLRVIDDAYVVHEGLALDQDLMPIPCTRRLYSDDDVEWARGRVRLLKERGELRRVGGLSLLCKARANSNYGHYLVEMLPKAWIGRNLFGLTGLKYIVQQNDILMVVAESMTRAGIDPNAIVWTDNDPVVCDRLLLLDGVTYHGQYQSPLCARALQEVSSGIEAGPAERIFVSRHARTRALLNEDRVEAALRARGFAVVEPGRMTLAEQIALFKGARIVVGALGAALTNIVFCEAATKVVAITSASFPDTFFWFLSLHRGLDYSEIRCPDVGDAGADAPWNAGFSITDADLAYL